MTIANRYLLPLMSELEDRGIGFQMFTKIDVKNGDHYIRIIEGDEWKMAIQCLYGLYKFLGILIGLMNVLATVLT
jgi:hypothetical protein